MESGGYSIKVKKADMEIEISGQDKEFVSTKFDEIVDILAESAAFEQASTKQGALGKVELMGENLDKPGVEGPVKLASEAAVTVEDLSNIYDFKDGIYIHKLLSGTDAEKQRIAAKLALIAYEIVLDVDELSGKRLGTHMTDMAIGSTSNLAQNLKADEGIIKRGTKYKLNAKGRKDALGLVKSLSAV